MNTVTGTTYNLSFLDAAERLKKIVTRTPLTFNQSLSKKYECNVFLKREDLQVVRSYKLRGAYNMMSSLPAEELNKGVVCASAGNDENLILLDEAPVYNTGHLLGFFSVFNSNSIKDVSLYKGAFPSQYGGRLSSILDIKMREGNDKK